MIRLKTELLISISRSWLLMLICNNVSITISKIYIRISIQPDKQLGKLQTMIFYLQRPAYSIH